MTDSFPLITIAIPCFNAEASIIRAIDSAINQNWPNKEIIIVDDCSTDNSAQVVADRISGVPFARLIKNGVNKGPGGTRDVLLREAKGEFIAYFDDDDESLPDRIAVQYERIVTHERETGEQTIACYASGIRHYPNGYKKELPAIGSEGVAPKGPDMAASILYYGKRKDWFYGAGTPTCCLMSRVSVLKEAGGFDADFRRVEDLDLSIRLSLKNASFIGCREILFVQHATSGDDKSSDKNVKAEIQLAEKHKDFLKTRGMYFYARTWPKLRHYHFTKQYGHFLLTLLSLLLCNPVKTVTHLLDTGPKRLKHEKRMAA